MEADLVIIGGGITGVGIARDAAMRGFSVTLIERGELGSGTSGYFHGVLHSGGRYVVNDPASAKECIAENKILRNIAKDALLDTGGLFPAITDQDLNYSDSFYKACKETNLPIEEISISSALKREPKLNPRLKRAFITQDAFIYGEKIIQLNKKAAEDLGVTFLTHYKVVSFEKNNNQIQTISVVDQASGEEKTIACRFVINAAGIWAGEVGKLANMDIPLVANKGSMVVLEDQIVTTIIHRCRPPTDGDWIVLDGTNSVLGTTSVNVTDINTHSVEKWEIEKLLAAGEELAPGISKQPIVRSYAGVRPLIPSSSGSEDGRAITRSFQIINHKKDDVENFISVVGGKFMIYRLMAEKAIDEMCANLNIDKPSQTAQVELI